ncbi:MAG: VCBS repeat-containing protein [Acidobacteria bacterium]|nr:VCBS repeat-containing protein [Acidobacteriota bacterium]
MGKGFAVVAGVVVLVCSCPAGGRAAVPEPERAALIALYNATGGDGWLDNTGWKTPPLAPDGFAQPGTEGSWYGVTLSGEDHVIDLSLAGNHLAGVIPSSIGNFPELTGLNFNTNQLAGQVPTEIGQLTQLVTLSAADNQLSGPLPASMGNLTHLRGITLHWNRLSGPIPDSFGNLAALEMLSIWSNQLSGPLPGSLANLVALKALILNDNQLTGPIPAWIGSLPILQHLQVDNNLFEGGPFPAHIRNLRELVTLGLTGCGLAGSIPEWIGELNKLETLHLSANLLAGPIPDSMNNLSHLRDLRLGNNDLTGVIPSALGSFADLTWLDLGGNDLSGPIPPGLGNLTGLLCLNLGGGNSLTGGDVLASLTGLTALTNLTLDGCGLTGEIPAALGQLSQLTELNLGNNDLSGPIPASLGQLTQLGRLRLQGNRLYGPIPPQLGNLSLLTYLGLENNRLSGPIPPELGSLPNLTGLDLSGNQLSGSIPAGLGNLGELRTLALGGNALSGAIPPELGNLRKLNSLVLDNNLLSGSIPVSFGDLTELGSIVLSYNQLSGPLPSSLGNLDKLLWLSLDHNRLSGDIPVTIAQLGSLETLNLASNEFSGTVPPGLAQLTNAKQINLGWNQLSGPLPPELGQMTWLQDVRIDHNRLTGPLPPEIGGMTGLRVLGLDSNALQGPVPATLVQLSNLQGLGLYWNALYSNDPAVYAFINSFSGQGDWYGWETIPPAGFHTETASGNFVRLAWVAHPYQGGVTGYEIEQALSQGGPFTPFESFDNHGVNATSRCACSEETRYYRIRSYCEPIEFNPNWRYSDWSPVVEVPASPPPSGTLTVYHDPAQQGHVEPGGGAQVLPASYLTFAVPPEALAHVTAANPAVIQVSLPAGAALSQTLADGWTDTDAPLAQGGFTVRDLAVSEYMLTGNDRPQATGTPVPAGIGEHAVQLLRYVAGEHALWVRVTESTSGWAPSQPNRFLGFTLGLGTGVWPPNGSSNLGPAGQHAQYTTLFFADLTDFAFGVDGHFPVSLCAFRQRDWAPAGVAIAPSCPSLFTQEAGKAGGGASAVAPSLTSLDTADVNGDGYLDMVSVDQAPRLLHWACGRADGTWPEYETLDLTPVAPVTVTLGDVTGDGRPDVLVSDTAGVLHVYPWAEVFGAAPKGGKPRAAWTARLAGTPGEAVLADVNRDLQKEYLFTDPAGGCLTVMSGPKFATARHYATGNDPRWLTLGDFDGDGWTDAAVARVATPALAVLLNDGAGLFMAPAGLSLAAAPVDLGSGDFNRDGRKDLVVLTAADKALNAFLSQPGGIFGAGASSSIVFTSTPAALQVENFDGINGADVLVGFSDDATLALCTTDASGTLTRTADLATAGNVLADPLNGTATLQPDGVLALAAGTTVGGVSSEQGVAMLQLRDTGVWNLPQSLELSFGVVNTGSTEALLTAEVYDDLTGAVKGAGTVVLPPGAQSARYVKEVVGTAAELANRWARCWLTASGVVGFWLVNRWTDTVYVDGGRVQDAREARTELVFPVMAVSGGRKTTVLLLNPNRGEARVSGQLIGPDGAAKGEPLPLLLSGLGRKVLDVGAAFPGASESDWLRVRSDQGLLGTTLFGPPQAMACAEALPVTGEGGALYSPHAASGDFGVVYASELSLVNPGAAAVTAGVELRDDAGGQLASGSVSIPAGGKARLDVGTFFGLSGAVTGYLRVIPDGDAELLGSIVFGETGEQGRFLSCLPLVRCGAPRQVMAHIANGEVAGIRFATGLAVLNTFEDSQVVTPVTLTAWNSLGLPLGEYVIHLPGKNRAVFYLDQVIPGLPDLFGGYLRLETPPSSTGIAAYELFHDGALQFLSAVPAVALP